MSDAEGTSGEGQRAFVVLALHRQVEAYGRVSTVKGCDGFMPVFFDREEAEKVAGERYPIMQVILTEQEQPA